MTCLATEEQAKQAIKMLNKTKQYVATQQTFVGLEDVLQIRFEDVLKTSWKTKNYYAEDVLKTS